MMKYRDTVMVMRDWQIPPNGYQMSSSNIGHIGHVMCVGFFNKDNPADPIAQVEFTGPIPFTHPTKWWPSDCGPGHSGQGRYATHVNYVPMSCLKVIGYDMMEPEVIQV